MSVARKIILLKKLPLLDWIASYFTIHYVAASFSSLDWATQIYIHGY